jgi:hypothetical protein
VLNNNKIISLINSEGNTPATISRACNINYQTLISKIKKGSWTPDDIFAFSEYFKKPLNYFFDIEDKGQITDHDHKNKKCQDCKEKNKIIKEMSQELKEIKDELIVAYRNSNNNNSATAGTIYRKSLKRRKTLLRP